MLQHLSLRDFRNFERLDVDVPSGGMVIIGENGHGKTNLLEAVSYLGLLRSVRGSRDADVVRFGAAAFHVRAQLSAPADYASVTVAYERSTKRKKATVDGVDHPKLSEALGALPSVCFSPVDVALVAGGPAERRHFLDVTLALTDSRYLLALQHYRAALRQRNAALRVTQRKGGRHAGANADGASENVEVSVWEPALAKHGATLASLRHTWCTRHTEHFAALCAKIGERAPVSMRYSNAASDVDEFRSNYLATFEQQRANELRRGVTLVGPHRDDLHLQLGERDLRTFGSNGQQRTAAIALRMLELKTLHETLNAPPLLLLDDPFSELDANRSARVLALLEESGVGQVLLTVPRDEDIPSAFTRLERRRMVNAALVSNDA
ncbi:MAG: DNA replication and repair protein RecF [Gemmatimonadaceae bacterium]